MILVAAALSVFAASSLREPFQRLAGELERAHPGVTVQLTFAGSQELRTQIENGAPADVFAGADLRQMEALRKAGLARNPRIFARNQLVIAVPPGNPDHVTGLRDLLRLERIVLAAPEVPAGHYAREALGRRNLDLDARVISSELNVRQAAQKVVLGEAQAAIVYRTDALALRGKVDAVDLPPADNVIAEYPIATITDSPLAAELVALALSPRGQEILAAAGFLRAP